MSIRINACLGALVSLCIPLAAQQTIKVDVNLVNVFATVKDDRGNFVTTLTRDDFRIYEDDQPRDFQIFEKLDQVDSSIGMLMDTSGSMVDILPFMRRGIQDFTRALPKMDEFFVVSFGTAVRLLHNSSQSQKHLEDGMLGLRAYGTSVLYDALLYSAERITRSSRPRKALIVFTDGNDNGSAAGHGRVAREVQSSGVLLYFVAIGSPILVDSHSLESLSDISGGRTLYVGKQDKAVSPVLDQIRAELAQQYYLGYYVPRQPGFHKIRVEVPGRNLKVRAKTGYIGG
ncbi:MAG: VWA domain-containing protein [Acidobacteria bacterium]|nr:VWA domain-containing protein [Acidobacteriota bacterium]